MKSIFAFACSVGISDHKSLTDVDAMPKKKSIKPNAQSSLVIQHLKDVISRPSQQK